MNEAEKIETEIIEALKTGDRDVQGEVLKRLEPWLRLLARLQAETWLKRRFDPSDIVQETLLEAHRSLPEFRGRSQGELLAWLKKILSYVLSHEVRRHLAEKRDAGREIPMDEGLTDASRRLSMNLGTSAGSPSKIAMEKEHEVLIALALERLPADYREVIILRNMESLSHEEIARRMGRSPGAVRMLWIRALAELKKVSESMGLMA